MSSSDLDNFLPENTVNENDLNEVAVHLGQGDSAALLDGRVQTAYDSITPASLGNAENSEKSEKGDKADKGDKSEKGDKKDKKIKSGQKVVSDALKTDMAAERTFFKWLWTGLHTGAIGTFIFVTFDTDKSDPYRIGVVAFAWIVAFALVLYGLYAYNRRRTALREGRIEILPPITREYGPLIVVVAIFLVVVSGLLYAILSGAAVHRGNKAQAFSGV